MTNIIRRRSINSSRLERWLGKEQIEHLAKCMTDGGGPGQRWYGQPIALLNVPGAVRITPDGDFFGRFPEGFFASAWDFVEDRVKRLWKEAGKPIYSQAEPVLGVGFASLSDAIARASAGYGQMLHGGQIQKTGATGVANVSSTLWRVGASPAAGAAGSAAPGGRAPTKATTGAMVFNNPASGTLHLISMQIQASVANNNLMLYDRLFDVAKTMNSAATEAVTGVPTRYQSTTAGNPDYVGSNFLFIEVGGTALAATAHNWTTCLYTNQAGTTGQTLPSVTGNSGAIVDRFDMPANTWFCPLGGSDVGVKALEQMQCSAAVATGAINFVIGHPIGVVNCPIAQLLNKQSFLNDDNLVPRVFDDACLALIELCKPSTTSTSYTGSIYVLNAAP